VHCDRRFEVTAESSTKSCLIDVVASYGLGFLRPFALGSKIIKIKKFRLLGYAPVLMWIEDRLLLLKEVNDVGCSCLGIVIGRGWICHSLVRLESK
jgi:hypothetical protein